jgi:UDP-glucuronate 4-epimerase
MSLVLVTGCAGFIGSRVCSMLIEDGHEVVGIDNLNNYYDPSLKQYRLRRLRFFGNKFKFELLNIENKNKLIELFKTHSFETVYNLAARAGVQNSLKDPYIYLSTNAVGTLNLLEAMKETNVKKMVLASTSSLYAGQQMPFTEDLAVNTPLSPYAASKKAAELMAYSYHHLYGLDISVVRYFTVFGPAGRPDMSIFRFIKWIDEGRPLEIFGDGSQSRDFTYVDDIARGTIQASKSLGYEILNLGGGKSPKSLNWTIDFICKERNLPVPARSTKDFHVADIVATQANISKANQLIGYEPKISFEEGLLNTLQWHKENSHWLKNIRI